MEEFEKIDFEIENIENKLRELEEKYKDGTHSFVKELFAGQAFISFRTESGKKI